MALNLKRKRPPARLPHKRPHSSSDHHSSLHEISDSDRKGIDDDDDDDDDDDSDADSDASAPHDSPPADLHNTTSHPHSNIPPRGQELRAIKDAADLYKSTRFKLQIDALLPNVRPNHLNELRSIAPKHPLAAARDLQKKGIAVPYSQPHPSEDSNWTVAFEKPEEIVLGGSWALKTSVKAVDHLKYAIDVAVTMPASLFQEKDYLNGRFFHKRAYYLAVIAASIVKNKKFNVDVLYQSVSGDPRSTTLVLQPREDHSETDFTKLNAQVRIVLALPTPSPIPLARLAPSRGNIRVTAPPATADAPNPPSPLYNTALLLSATPKPHLQAAHALVSDGPAFADALALLRVWAAQRGFAEGARLCVHGFEGRGSFWVGVLELLVRGGEPLPGPGIGKAGRRPALGKSLTSYQLFKAALDFLAKHDFGQERIFVKCKEGHRFTPNDYASHEAVFVDSTSLVNLLAGMPLSLLDMLKYDAQLTTDLLSRTSLTEDSFDPVFLQEHRNISTRFDIIARINLDSAQMTKPSPLAVVEHGSPYNALLASIVSLLRQGLGNRTKAVALLHPSGPLRPVSQADPTNAPMVYIGLILDTDHAFRLVDHGPPAAEQDSAEAVAFRAFWGEKAELRRFKDGRITESVVWDVQSVEERAQIPALIVRHVLAHHCALEGAAVWAWHAQFDAVLRQPDDFGDLLRARGAQTGTKAALGAFDALVRAIKALDEELGLAILNVSPVSDALRYTSVFSPAALPPASVAALPQCARFVALMPIIIEFEKSGRWPDDLRAVQTIKLAFFERLASALMAAQKGWKASVVVGDESSSDIQDAARLEILTADGWAFSAHIWHDREATLLEQLIELKMPAQMPKQPGQDAAGPRERERQQALDALAVYQRRFVHAPRHHRAIAALCHKFSAFAGTVRLAKRWLAAHWLLHGHVSAEAVELLCARVFLAAGPGVPGSKERGFAQVVALLRDWDWRTGLSIPLYAGADAERSDVPPAAVAAGVKEGVWALATEVDAGGHVWTASGPDALAARRVQSLAQATWACLQTVEHGQLNVKTAFVHPTDDYDFVVELEPGVLPRYHQNVAADPAVWTKKGKYANAPSLDAGLQLPAGFDPAELLFRDLRRVYKGTFQLFRDAYGGDRFGAVWDPTVRNPRPFRVLGGFSSTPQRKDTEKMKEKDRALVVLNEASVLAEIERMGSGLIKRILVRK